MTFGPKNKKFPVIFEKFEQSTQGQCKHPQVCNHIECLKNVVYALEMECGAKYYGETSRCFKTRLSEHIKNIEGSEYSQEGENERKASQYSKISTHMGKC
jgi:hypothetical protein